MRSAPLDYVIQSGANIGTEAAVRWITYPMRYSSLLQTAFGFSVAQNPSSGRSYMIASETMREREEEREKVQKERLAREHIHSNVQTTNMTDR